VFEFLLILFGFTATGPDDIVWDPIACDDGSAPWHAGLPNWDCELYECTPLDSLCWPERLDGCYTASGAESGACTIETSLCDSRLSCFNLWVHCGGTYECHEDDSWIGCTSGSCRSAASPRPKPPAHVSDVGPAAVDPPEPDPVADPGLRLQAADDPARLPAAHRTVHRGRKEGVR
jgi:hypothetical protein